MDDPLLVEVLQATCDLLQVKSHLWLRQRPPDLQNVGQGLEGTDGLRRRGLRKGQVGLPIERTAFCPFYGHPRAIKASDHLKVPWPAVAISLISGRVLLSSSPSAFLS